MIRKKQLVLPIPTFLFMIINIKAIYSYNKLHIFASFNIWHQKIKYIRLLKLYKLERSV